MFDKYAAIGDLLLVQNVVTERQLKRGVSLQLKERLKGRWRKLGEILVELGYCTQPEVERLVSEQESFRQLHDTSEALEKFRCTVEDNKELSQALTDAIEERLS